MTYRSPFTQDPWPDVRTAIGSLAGIATYINDLRPRRKPPEGHDEAIKQAVEAAGAICGIPKLDKSSVVGRVVSDAYWLAKEAKVKLEPLTGDSTFLRNQEYWREWREAIRRGDEERKRWDIEFDFACADQAPTLVHTRVARIAWYACQLVTKAATNLNDLEITAPSSSSYYSGSYGHRVVMGALTEVEEGGFDFQAIGATERVWRFVVAAGRLPVLGADDDLLAAFEAAIMVDEHEFATRLARSGFGFSD